MFVSFNALTTIPIPVSTEDTNPANFLLLDPIGKCIFLATSFGGG